jgi:glycosyltransferase involved in cell wall biosynthesis
LPIVATAAGGIPYIAENERTALLVPLDDHEAMAAAALRLLEEEGLAVRLARAGRAELRKFTWDGGVRDTWMRAYAELAARPDVAAG